MGWETVRQAFVLINSEPGAEATVLKALEAIPEVKESHFNPTHSIDITVSKRSY
jgi:hypothetical protein